MQIKKDVYYSLIKACPIPPPECGGILGGKDGVINISSLDNSKNSGECYSYSPNTDSLNSILALWAAEDIEFYGVFHTHSSGGHSLSIPDREFLIGNIYIK